MDNISAVVITLNEEKNIERCLNSLVGLSGEIIVVDGGSKDNTIELAKQYTDKVFFNEWNNDFAAQKNFAISKASGSWILSLDADEEISHELAAEIKEFMDSSLKEKFGGMMIPRKNIIFGKWLKHGECWPDYQLRLFRKSGQFIRSVHESVEIGGEQGFLKSPIIHHHYLTARQFISKAKKYTDLELKNMKIEGDKNGIWKIAAYPLAKFFKVYLFQKAFLDGKEGLSYSVLLAYYSFLKRYKYYKYFRTLKP